MPCTNDITQPAKICISICDEFQPASNGKVETYAYVECDGTSDEFNRRCLSHLVECINQNQHLLIDDEKIELEFYDAANTFPEMVGTEYAFYLYKRWQINFKQFTSKRLNNLIEKLEYVHFQFQEIPLDIYSKS